MMNKVLRISYYIIKRLGCIHPYRISRILVLANWKAIEDKGCPIVYFNVSGFEAGFSVDELSKLKNDKCIRINKENRCMEYICEDPEIDEYDKKIIDEVIEEVSGLSDIELNRVVIRDRRYKELLSKGGFKPV